MEAREPESGSCRRGRAGSSFGRAKPLRSVARASAAAVAVLAAAAVLTSSWQQAFVCGSLSGGLRPGGQRLGTSGLCAFGNEGRGGWRTSWNRPKRVSLMRSPEMQEPLPWPHETAEVMIDAISVIHWYFKKTAKLEQDLRLQHDAFCFWPARLVQAAKLLRRDFGRNRPPSPWEPIVLVFDLPDPGHTWSGMQVKRYKNLAKQGPRRTQGLTLAWSQTYVDMSAAEIYRCDREILYMLEVLTRNFPRRQVLVTDDARLAKRAMAFCTVRSPEWFDQELMKKGKEGERAIDALMGDSLGIQDTLDRLPEAVKKAFTAA